MQINIDEIHKSLEQTSFAPKVKSFIIYGSSVNNQSHLRKSNDTDMCIVLSDRCVDLKELSRFLYGNFDNPDFVIYYEDEVYSGLPFRDTGVGSFCIEFFAHGVLVWGENIFKPMLISLDRTEYLKSHLEKIFEYILRIRSGFHSKSMSGEDKLVFLNKYIIRLLRGILLYEGHVTYLELEQLENTAIYSLAKKLEILSSQNVVDFNDSENLYAAFDEISSYVVCKHTRRC